MDLWYQYYQMQLHLSSELQICMTLSLLGLFGVNVSSLKSKVGRFLTLSCPLADAKACVREAAATVGDGCEASQ